MLDTTTITSTDFPTYRYADDLVALTGEATRVLRVFRDKGEVDVFDGLTDPCPDWDPVTVFLLGCGDRAIGIFPVYKNERVDLATAADNLLTDHESTYHNELDQRVYPDGTFIVQVDFGVEDGSIETARDVTEDAGVITDTDAYRASFETVA